MEMSQLAATYAIAIGGGIFAGWFSHRYQALFLAALAGAGAILSMVGGHLAPLLKVGAAASGIGVLQMPGYLFSLLPLDVQNAFYLAVIIAVASRIVTWYHARFLKKDKVETKEKRRARILKDFKYEDDFTRAVTSGNRLPPIGSAKQAVQDPRRLAGFGQ